MFFLVAHWLVVLKPEISADGLAMHLAIPANIALHHQMTFEPARFLWAVMPMAADFAYSIVYLLGGEYATRLLVFAMLLAVCATAVSRDPPLDYAGRGVLSWSHALRPLRSCNW